MATSRGRLAVEYDDDYEREDSPDYQEQESYHAQGDDDVVSFPTIPKKKKKLVKKLTRRETAERRNMKSLKIFHGLVKPDVTTDRGKERELRRIATKGVVQLFNAVSDRQSTLSEELKKKMNARERKMVREKYDGKNFDVNKFSEVQTKSEVKEEDEEDFNNLDEKMDETNYSDED